MRNKLLILFLVLLLVPAIRPLLRNGFFTMHDDQQIVRLAQLDEALVAGQFPVRWVSDLGFGYGYPLFIFYPPLVYYTGELFHLLLGLSYIDSMKIVFGISFVGAALTMYVWSKKHFGAVPAVVAALFYTYAPYRAVDAYVRGALAESFAFVWLPLILLSIDRIAELSAANKDQKLQLRWIILLGISYAALMITHNLIVLPFTLIMVLYWLGKLIFMRSSIRWQFTKHLIISGVIGVGLSTFFWLPALYEKQFTIVDSILLAEKYDHSLHYVYKEQLWNSIWGYGGSTEGTLDGFSLKIGKVHVVGALVVGLLSLLVLLRTKVPMIKNLAKYTVIFQQLLLVFILGLSSVWMTTEYSAVIWDNFSPIQFLQFPWRFLTFIVLFSSFLVGASIWIVQKLVKPKWITYISAVVLVVLLFIPNLKLFQPQTHLDVTDEFYTSDEFTKWHISKTSFEFVPKGVETTIQEDLNITQLAISEDQIAVESVTTEPDTAEVAIHTNKPHLKEVSINASEPTLVTFNTFNFPGWQLWLDGEEAPIDDTNRLKLITTEVPSGETHLEIKFTNTPVRVLANSVTLLTLIGVVLFSQRTRLQSLLKQS